METGVEQVFAGSMFPPARSWEWPGASVSAPWLPTSPQLHREQGAQYQVVEASDRN